MIIVIGCTFVGVNTMPALSHTTKSGSHSDRIQSRLSVCLFVLALTGKRLERSTPNLVHVYSIAVARHVLTQRSKGQRSRSHDYENRHGRTVASDHVPSSAYPYAAVLPAAVAGVGLHVDTTAYVFYFLVAVVLIDLLLPKPTTVAGVGFPPSFVCLFIRTIFQKLLSC